MHASGVVLLLAAAAGCSLLPVGDTSLTTRSDAFRGPTDTAEQTGGELELSESSARLTSVYRGIDENTADVYVTDLPLSRLADPEDNLADASGMIVHVHIFLVPKAGSTPIDATASNAAVRQVVLASGATGVYGGGGFVSVRDEIGDENFGAVIRGSSVRLVRRGPGFADRLGPSTVRGTLSARRDERAARAIAARMDLLISGLKPAGGS